jgi:5-methylcytosine-specific restriction protein A
MADWPYNTANWRKLRAAVSLPLVRGLQGNGQAIRGREAGAVRSSKPRRGCDEHGNPLDAAHPWRSY